MQKIWRSIRANLTCALALFAVVLGGQIASAQKQIPVPMKPPRPKPAPVRTIPDPKHPTEVKKAGGEPSGQHPAKPKLNIHSRNLPLGAHKLDNGHTLKVGTNNSRVELDENSRVVRIEKPGLSARFNASSHPESFHLEQNGASQTLHRGPGGMRVVEGVHPAMGGGSVRVVGYSPRNGFVDRPIDDRYGYTRRSSMVGGHLSAVVYRGSHYRGVNFYKPVPAVVYAPAYYKWAVRPWPALVSIQLGFASQPWYSAYGITFTPYSVYASPDQWMTDQILASNMQQSFDLSRDSQGTDAAEYPPAAPPQISTELKSQIDAQVKLEVGEIGQAASGGAGTLAPAETPTQADELPDALKPGHIAFRVVMPVSAEVEGLPCSLNGDDWILRTGDLAADGTVPVRVATSRSGECTQGSATQVSLNDLMTMQNEQDQQVMAVLKMAADSMGKGGMPAGPAGGSGATPFPGGVTSPDGDVAESLQKEQGEAAVAENEVVAAATKGGQ